MNDRAETPVEGFRDRSLGLLLFGVLEILIGVFCALLIPLSLIATAIIPESAGYSADLRSTIPPLVLYLVMALVFVWLGVGSIRARRWARDLMLSLSWVWLLTGICTLVLSWLILPSLLSEIGASVGLSAGGVAVVAALMVFVLGFVYVLLPGVIILFYRSENVIATCRARGPQKQWTDDCPPRLLTLTILWALTAVSVLAMPAYRFVTPFFGTIVDGAAGAVVWVVVFVCSSLLAWGTCRRATWAWWTGVTATVLATLSTVFTFVRVDAIEFYRAMDLPEEQFVLLAGMANPERWVMVLIWIVVWSSFLAYLFAVRVYFRPISKEST